MGQRLKPYLSSDSPLLAVLGQIERQAQEIAASLQGSNLMTDEGRFEALKTQGVVQGMRQAVEMFISPLSEVEEDENKA